MSIYQHYRDHEHPFIDRVLSFIEHVENHYSVYLTDFLDPREQYIIQSLIGNNNDEIHYSFFGGREGVERRRAVIAPAFVSIERDHFELAVLEATYSNKFSTITHRDVLGTLSSLGIDRNKLGDILVHDHMIHIVTTKQLAPFIQMNVTKMKRTNLSFETIEYDQLKLIEQEWQEKSLTVSSLRLDVIIKEMYQLSRNKASKLIESERVKINHTIVNEPAIQLVENDMLSVRGFGRSKLVKVDGTTRKGKLKITVAFLVG